MKRFLALLPFVILFGSCLSTKLVAPREAGDASAAPKQESAGVAAKKARHKQRDGSAKFDFYVLSLSWSPQHCATSRGRGDRNDDIQCAPGRLYDFVLHGMWPQYEQGWPQDCNTEPVDRGTVDSMLDIMPSAQLVRHEWSKHGTCSGLTAKDYFEDARAAFRSIKIPDPYKHPDLQVVTTPAELRQRFAEANPAFPENGFAVVCSGRFLQEVRACLTTDFEPRACSKEVLKGQCRTDEMVLRPVR
jgi:ribonuclease T2